MVFSRSTRETFSRWACEWAFLPGSVCPVRRGTGLLLVVGALVVSTVACGPSAPPAPPAPMEAPDAGVGEIVVTDGDYEDLLPPPPMPTEERLADPILGSTLVDHPEFRRRVNYWILRWQMWEGDHFNRYLERMEWYIHLVDGEIERRGLPPSLRYLPLVESGYNPSAYSPAGAAGMWQFMPGTARFVGMDVNALIDERRDPWRSTEMALEYLIELDERFEGSWYLALAAYNGGWGRVQRILDRYAPGAEPSDSLFWALREHFPAETRDYVPKLLAAAWVAENPEVYGFEPGPEVGPEWAEEVRISDATSLDVVARAAGAEIDEVERFNPHLIRGYTPPDRETAVRIPAGSASRFHEVFPTIPPDERVSFVEHRIRRGETLSHVADRYRVPMRELRAANPRLNPRRLQIGQWVVVPRSPSAGLASNVEVRTTAPDTGSDGSDRAGGSTSEVAAATSSSSDQSAYLPPGFEVGSDSDHVVHRVGSGESLWQIARRYWVHVAEVRAWNDLDDDDVIQPGDELVIRGVRQARRAVYRVQAGDTLSEIALRHGVGTDELMRVNGIARSGMIRPGDEVRIPAQ